MLREGRIPSRCIEAHPAGCKAGGAGGLPAGSAPAPGLEGAPRAARGSRQPRAARPGLGSQPGTEQPDLCACRGALRGAPCPWGCGTRSPLLRFLPKMLGHPGSRAMETEISQPASPAGKGRRDGEAPLRAAAEPLCPPVSPARMRAFPGVAPPVLRGLRADAGAGGLLPCRLSSPRRVLLLWEGAGLGFPPLPVPSVCASVCSHPCASCLGLSAWARGRWGWWCPGGPRTVCVLPALVALH